MTMSMKIREEVLPKYFLPVALGGSLGLFLIFFLNQEGEWRILGLAGLLVPLVMMFAKNPRRLYLAALLMFIPFSTNYTFNRTPYLASGAQGFSIALSDIALMALLVLWIVDILLQRDKIRFFPQMTIPILCLIAVSALSLYRSTDTQLSIFELFRQVKLLIFFVVVANHIKSEDDIKLALLFLLGGLFIESIIAGLQMLKGGPLGLSIIGEYDELKEFALGGTTTYRVGATLRNSNTFSKYLTVLLPLAFSLFLSQKNTRHKIVLGGIAVLGVLALVMTLTRSAWIGLAVSVILLMVLFLKNKRLRTSTASQMLVLGLVLLIIIATQLPMLVSRFTADDRGSAYSRIPMMQVAWHMIEENPFLGVGINNYTTVMLAYDNTTEQIVSHFPMPVHNVFLLYATEIGIIGLLVYLTIVFQACRQGFALSRDDHLFKASIAIGMTAGIVSLLIQDMVDWSTKYDYALITLLWLYFACLCAMKHPSFRTEHGTHQ